MSPTLMLAAAVASATSLAVLLLVARRPQRPLGAPRALAAGAAAGAAMLAQAGLLVPLGLDGFGLLLLAYLGLFAVLPLAALALLAGERRRRARRLGPRLTRGARALCVLALVPLPAARAGRGPLRIAVLADLQTDRIGAHERRAVAAALAFDPHLILLPGDLFQGLPSAFERHRDDFRALLARLEAPGGVWFVHGDCDTYLPRTAELLVGTGVRVLTDRVVELEVAGRRVTLAGVRNAWPHPDARAAARELEARPGEGDVRLLLAHRPDALWLLPADPRTDLVVAGHTHGGQVQLPWLGPPLTLSDVPRRVAAGGLHAVDGRRIYVSRGIGMERAQAPRIRFLCRPEVSLLTLGGG